MYGAWEYAIIVLLIHSTCVSTWNEYWNTAYLRMS
jgi:hypothetical protein